MELPLKAVTGEHFFGRGGGDIKCLAIFEIYYQNNPFLGLFQLNKFLPKTTLEFETCSIIVVSLLETEGTGVKDVVGGRAKIFPEARAPLLTAPMLKELLKLGNEKNKFTLI